MERPEPSRPTTADGGSRSLGATAVTHHDIVRLLESLAEWGCDFTGVELLYRYDGNRGFSLAQGQ